MNYEFELVTDNDILEQNNRIIRNWIINFNAPFVGGDADRYSIYLKDSETKIIGGACVYAHVSSIYIDVLWVSDSHRAKGLGAKLLQKVEVEAIRRGNNASTLDTFSFQAERFYCKQGYHNIGTVHDYLEGHDRIFMRKKLLEWCLIVMKKSAIKRITISE